MRKHWITTVLGGLAGLAAVAHGSGLTLGHFGGSDFITIIGGVATLLFGAYAADANKTQ